MTLFSKLSLFNYFSAARNGRAINRAQYKHLTLPANVRTPKTAQKRHTSQHKSSMIDLQNRREIILEAFKNFTTLGYVLKESSIKITEGIIKDDLITIIYQSTVRTLTINYSSTINYMSEQPNQRLIEIAGLRMTNDCGDLDSNTDRYLDIVHYFRLMYPDTYLKKLQLYNDSEINGIHVKEFEEKMNHYSSMILDNLKEVTLGKKWVSASLTRLDGWRIETEKGVKYFD